MATNHMIFFLFIKLRTSVLELFFLIPLLRYIVSYIVNLTYHTVYVVHYYISLVMSANLGNSTSSSGDGWIDMNDPLGPSNEIRDTTFEEVLQELRLSSQNFKPRVSLDSSSLSILLAGIDELQCASRAQPSQVEPPQAVGPEVIGDESDKYKELRCKLELGNYAGTMYNDLIKLMGRKQSSAQGLWKTLKDERAKGITNGA